MKCDKRAIMVLSLAVLMVSTFSCKRDQVGLPGPTGPSTLATLLKLSVSPNVIAAGINTRQTVGITANLSKFDGSPVPGTTVHFDLRDELGFKVYLGFLDGSQTVVSKVTDGSGNVSVTYHGPFVSELNLTAAKIYISAYVGWEGKEIVTELCPIWIIGDVFETELAFELQAFPNVLWCSSVSPTSTIRGVFTYLNGVPIVGRKVFFKIVSGPRGAEGQFADGYTKTFAVTDEDGVAEVIYYGPTRDQLSADSFVTIQGQPETDWIHIYDPQYDPPGTDPNDKFYIHKEMQIRLIKGTGAN